MAHPDVLAAYLELVANDGMKAFGRAEEAFAVLGDETSLRKLLGSYDLDTLQDVISSLEAFEDEYPREAVVPASRVLLSLLPTLPERPQGMLSLGGTRLVVTRVVLRLMRRLDGPDEAMAAVKQILPAVASMSSRLELLTLVGFREGAGHKLVSAEAAEALEEEFRAQLVAMDRAELARERDVLRLLYAPKGAGGKAITVEPDQAELVRAVLLDGRSEVQSQQMGSRAVRRTYRLHWDVLVEVFDGEDNLRAAIDTLRADQDEAVRGVVDLADRYLGGWRPTEWGDE